VFNVIAGLLDADSGEIVCRGEKVDGLRGRVGYMMQRDLLLPWRTAVKRMLTEDAYPKSVDITPKALTVAMDTQIGLGNLKQQPKYDTFIARNYMQAALAAK
jgi:ABC-type nitrate/sulfonate/bicarbonate transport system ATPase subunit